MEREITPQQALNRDLAIELDGWKWWGAQSRGEPPRCRYLDKEPHGYTGHFDPAADESLVLCADWHRYVPRYSDSGDGMLLLTKRASEVGYLTNLFQKEDGWHAIVWTEGCYYGDARHAETPMAVATAILEAIRRKKTDG